MAVRRPSELVHITHREHASLGTRLQERIQLLRRRPRHDPQVGMLTLHAAYVLGPDAS